jgi:hypothetical protein
MKGQRPSIYTLEREFADDGPGANRSVLALERCSARHGASGSWAKPTVHVEKVSVTVNLPKESDPGHACRIARTSANLQRRLRSSECFTGYSVSSQSLTLLPRMYRAEELLARNSTRYVTFPRGGR